MSPVIFLDLDGVCNDAAFIAEATKGVMDLQIFDMALAQRTLDPTRVARVQRICDETGAGVVFVTGWRRWATCDEITACLRAVGLTASILGVVGQRFSGDCRATMTRWWLQEHPEVTRWVVVDDLASHWAGCGPWLAGRWVRPADGLTEADAARAIQILQGAETPSGGNDDPADDSEGA